MKQQHSTLDIGISIDASDTAQPMPNEGTIPDARTNAPREEASPTQALTAGENGKDAAASVAVARTAPPRPDSGFGKDPWDGLEIPKSVQDAVGTIGDVVGAVSTAVSWIGTVQEVLKLAGLIGTGPNEFDTLFQKIEGELRILLSATLAGTTEKRLRDVAQQVALAQTAAIQANEFIVLGRPTAPFYVDRLAENDRDSLLVMKVLSSESWWLRTYDPRPEVWRGKAISGETSELLGLLPWYGVDIKPVKPVGGLIWDYRHILPAYVQAVAARVVVLKARSADFAQFVQIADGEIRGYVDFLTAVGGRIHGSIRTTLPLQPQANPDRPLGAGSWMIGLGSVETYTGLNHWTIFEPSALPNPPRTVGEAVRRFNEILNDTPTRVFEAAGLSELTRLMDNLRSLLVDPCGLPADATMAASAALIGCDGNQASQHLVVPGIDGGMHIAWKPGAQAGWQWHNAGKPSGQPLAVSEQLVVTGFGEDADRRIYAFAPVHGASSVLHCYWWNGGRWQWASQGSPVPGRMDSLAATTFALSGRQHIRAYTVIGGRLYVNWWGGVRWDWVDLGAPAGKSIPRSARPTVTTYRYNGRLLDDLYVIIDGQLHEHTWYEDGTRNWVMPPASPQPLYGSPNVLVHDEDGQPIVDVFALDKKGQLHSLQWRSAWRWHQHGTPPGTTVRLGPGVAAATVRYGDKPRLTVAVTVGNDRHIWVRADTGANQFWYDLGGNAPEKPKRILGATAHVRNDGKLPVVNVFVRGADRHLYTTEYGFWDTWHDLGGP